jgi:hypothetical protein
VVIGRLGVGPQGAGPFTEQLDVRGEVVAFPIGGDGGCGGQPGTGVGGFIGPRAKRLRVVECAVDVGELGSDVLPPASNKFSGSVGELELLVGPFDGG